MGKISAVFLARKKRSITFIVNYELRLSLYSNRVKGRGWNIYKFLVERKPAKRILWRHLKWRWKERKGRQETWLQLRPWDAITCNNTWRGKRSYGDNTFPDAKKEPNFFKKKKLFDNLKVNLRFLSDESWGVKHGVNLERRQSNESC